MKFKQVIKSILPDSFVYWYLSISRKSYSQAGQDFWVYGEVFNKKQNGFFVEIGSADGITYNNTYLLESKFKWKGICVEANPVLYKSLIKLRQAECVNACIDEKEGMVLFKNCGLDSGIVFDESLKDRSGLQNDDFMELKSQTLETVFRKYKLPSIIDYMSMDIEGAEWIALKNFPFSEYRFNCITLERPNDDLRTLLHKEGYVIIKEIPGLDVFFIHKTFIHDYQINLMNYWEINKTKKSL